ncbi:DUF1285 domain-containing protein [Endozoicomonas sp. Mp262]|uniref:DUF1285 domain-containing protein n=1 Tax=Endozoicomonas sp. Mp262 TaxID=2919499 RepID=UPI0021D8C9A9
MTRQYSSPSELVESLTSLPKGNELPPIHLWDPPFCGDIDIRILSDGSWLYMGTAIDRVSMVRLFSTVLKRDEDGSFYLVTPVEKVRIQVDDAPFVAISVERREDKLYFLTNVGDQCVLGEHHGLWVLEEPVSGEPKPYIRVRDNLDALINRNTFYQLIDMAEEKQINGKCHLVISSSEHFYSLGSIEDSRSE